MNSDLLHPVAGHLLRLAAALPVTSFDGVPDPVTVLYHGVQSDERGVMPARVFEEHVRFLSRHFTFMAAHDPRLREEKSVRRRIVLTFDDGFRNNAEVVAPILRRHNAPAMFFVCSRHATAGKYLWFSYLKAVEQHFPESSLTFRDHQFDMRPEARARSVRQLRRMLLKMEPHPAAMYAAIDEELPALEGFVEPGELANTYAGMSVEQIAELADDPLFSFGAHTQDHPFLTRCTTSEARNQIQKSRQWVEDATGRPCEDIAYPSGDYTQELLQLCREAGFTRGYSVNSRFDRHSEMEVPRFGIYSQSTAILGFKIRWGHLMRVARIPVG